MDTKLLTTVEAAERLGVTAIRVRQLIKAGRLPSQQFGRDHLINEADLARVSDRKPGRPKTKADADQASPPAETKPPAKKRTSKKAGN